MIYEIDIKKFNTEEKLEKELIRQIELNGMWKYKPDFKKDIILTPISIEPDITIITFRGNGSKFYRYFSSDKKKIIFSYQYSYI